MFRTNIMCPLNRKKLKTALLYVVFTLLIHALMAQDQALKHFVSRTYTSAGNTLPYRVMYPANFNPELQYPLILFLHGAGERGNDNKMQLTHGGGFFASDSNRQKFPAVVVFPQCPPDDYWAKVRFDFHADGSRIFHFDPGAEPTIPMQLTIALLDSLLNQSWIDTSRVFIGGLSMGGMGTFELLYRMPQIFAGAFPICGAGNPEMINSDIRNVQVWAFHGMNDAVVKPELSEIMIEAYVAAGSCARITLYPEVGHNVWEYVFQSPGLLPWIFSIGR